MPAYKKTVKKPTMYRKRRYVRKTIVKKSNTFAKRVKSIMLKNVETKEKSYGYGIINVNHNTPSTILLNSSAVLPSQGTGDNQRVGDRINVSGFLVKLLFGQQADRPNVTWKLWVVRVPKGQAYLYTTWFNDLSSNVLLDDINNDVCKVLVKRTYKPYTGRMENATDQFTFARRLWVPYRKLLKFVTNASTNHDDGDIHLMIAPYDAYGTLLTDTLGYFQANSTIYYKDP